MDVFVDRQKGLSLAEVVVRTKRYGKNIYKIKQINIILLVLREFFSPLIILLMIAAIFSYFTDSVFESLTIVLVIFINFGFGLFHKLKIRSIVDKLTKSISSYVDTIREGKVVTLEKSDLVPGDIILLKKDMIIPADCMILHCEELLLNESVLTGESQLISKKTNIQQDIKYEIGMVYSGTIIHGGTGIAKILKTGDYSKYGKILQSTNFEHKKSLYEENIGLLSKDLIILASVFVLFILTMNLIFNHDNRIPEILFFIIAIAVTLVPEGLPTIASICLANAAKKMFSKGILIKNMAAIEDLGDIDVLCTDKTGTLTENRLSVALIDNDKISESEFEKYLFFSSLDSDDSFDKALQRHLKDKFNKPSSLYYKDIPFDPKKKYSKREFKDYSIIKGVSNVLLKDMPAKMKDEILSQEKSLTIRGWRSLAYILKKGNETEFLGFVYFSDKIKKDIPYIISSFKQQNIEIKIITGDSFETSKYIAQKIGLINSSEQMIEASDIDFTNQSVFGKLVREKSVFCRTNPFQKEKIIQQLIKEGHRVAYLGDGINDIPSLSYANVGIVVENASDMAKRTADIVLTSKNLKLIFDAIFEGRKTFENTDKYIKHVLVGNFGNFFTLGVVSLFLKFLPMLPIQILISNLILDVTTINFAFDNVDKNLIKKPSHRNFNNIIKYSLVLGFLTTIMDLFLIAMIKDQPVGTIQTLWFATSAVAELLFVFSVRTNLVFFKSRPRFLLVFTVGISILIMLFLTFVGIQAIPKDNIISLSFLPFVLFVSLLYFILTEIGKLFLLKRFNEQNKKYIGIN